MANCCNSFNEKIFWCDYKLTVIGHISGWLGIIWRSVVTVLLITTISNLTPDDPSIYPIFMASFLTYFILSIILNVIFIIGICNERCKFMLAYITVVALEMIIIIIVSSGLVMLLFALNSIRLAIYTMVIAICFVGIHFTLWVLNILLYKDLQDDAMVKGGKRVNISLTDFHSIGNL